MPLDLREEGKFQGGKLASKSNIAEFEKDEL